jgi:S1-C subfamily serine protease
MFLPAESLFPSDSASSTAAAKPLRSPASERVSLASALYERAAPAVVGITCRSGQSNVYFGTGTIIDPSGLVLSSVTVVPKDARQIQVYLRGGRVLSGRSLLVEAEKEVVLLRLEGEAPRGEGFPFVRLGDSRSVQLGDPAFSLGNAFQSIENDDQVSLGEGIVSGYFRLKERQSQSTYIGLALETSAPINSGMDGGPLLDQNGEVIGLLSLNYSRNRWLGTAIPIHVLKPLLNPCRGSFSDRDEVFRAYAGLELEELGEAGARKVRVSRVDDGGPASKAGLSAGDVVTAVGDKPLESTAAFRAAFGEARPGGKLRLETVREGTARRLELDLLGNF